MIFNSAFLGINWSEIATPERIADASRAAVLLLIGIPLLVIATIAASRATRRRVSPQSAMIVRKVVMYGGGTVLLLTVLYQLGFQFTALLGAAGVLGIAIGFASQTSVSQIISGLFLIGEKPFEVGDLVQVSGKTGIILSIDFLSVKMRTFDNQFVRIPNETLIRTEVVNITRFPLRRIDIKVGVAYREDVARVREVLARIARNNPYCLDEPEPLILFTDFGDSSLNFLFGVWCVKTDFLVLRNTIMDDIKRTFDEEDIEIPFPHRTIYTGSVTTPMPIQLTSAMAAQDLQQVEQSGDEKPGNTAEEKQESN